MTDKRSPQSSALKRRRTPQPARVAAISSATKCLVVVGEGVAHIGDERQPRRGLRRRDAQPRAVDGVVDHRGELMRRYPRREAPERHFDIAAFGHLALF